MIALYYYYEDVCSNIIVAMVITRSEDIHGKWYRLQKKSTKNNYTLLLQ